MNNVDVPEGFPEEFLASAPGAQAKLLVHLDVDGRYVAPSVSLRAERWAICADLCAQLVVYVNNHWNGAEPREAFADKVARAVDSKRAAWGISVAEADWIKARLRAEVEDGTS